MPSAWTNSPNRFYRFLGQHDRNKVDVCHTTTVAIMKLQPKHPYSALL